MQLFSDAILVKVQEDRVSKGGIAIPKTSLTVGNEKGEVVAVGPGELVHTEKGWNHKPHNISVGSLVLLAPHAGRDIRIDGKLHILCKAHEIWSSLRDFDEVD